MKWGGHPQPQSKVIYKLQFLVPSVSEVNALLALALAAGWLAASSFLLFVR